MAELILSPIADKIIGSLCSADVREIATLWGVKKELEELQNTISLIKAVLHDAEKKQFQNDGVAMWLRSLGDAVHDADDLMDEFDTEALRRELMNGNEVAKQVCTFFSGYNQLTFRHKMGRRIRDIRKKLAAASNDQSFLCLEVRSSDEESGFPQKRETHSFVRQEDIIGRDEEREAIVKLLLERHSEENVSVIPVVGMGGLGKTTLVQSVFNDERVNQHFELKIWVCTSDNFDLKVIVRKITNMSKEVDLDQLQQSIRKMLGGKRYLLVLDDVWEENRENWLGLKNLLICGGEGSRVVVTSRSKIVAAMTSPMEPYELAILNEEKSWSLFRKMAFRRGQDEENPDLVGIGKEIVMRCRGIPLAIRTIGNTLYCKHSQFEWSFFHKEFSNIPREGTIMPTLRLSYNNLASHLKHCFAYCRLFPKNYRIKVPMLIQLWMAQGFLESSDFNRDQCLDDVGYKNFSDLFERSFFQEAKFDKFGFVKSCKMHDLIHDLAVEVAGQNISTGISYSNEVVGKNIRHLSLDFDVDSPCQISTSFVQARKIRTLILTNEVSLTNDEKQFWNGTISKFKQLRTLDLNGSICTVVPKYISRLNHVRYLDLTRSRNIKTLPNSISNLINLQTLKLNSCSKLQELPRDMKKLVNLTHLEIDGCYELRHMPVGFGQLTKLTRLSMYVLPKSIDHAIKHRGELRELSRLNNLRGSLKISNLRYGDTGSGFVSLKEKQYLRSLCLEWEETEARINEDEMSLLEGLKPHPNLQKLSLDNYECVNLPNWLPSLTKLVSLSISSCENCKHLIPMDRFIYLKKLVVSNLPSLEYMIDGNTNRDVSCSSPTLLPSLRKLSLFDLPNLKGWWRENQHKPLPCFPRLTTLEVENCPHLTRMPLYPLLEELVLRKTSFETFEQTIQESSSSISSLSKLQSLEIGEVAGLEYLPESFENLVSLKTLKIRKSSSLVNLSPGILYLTSLKDLRIWSMDDHLKRCDEIVWNEMNGRLTTLTLCEFHKMETLPEGIRQVTSLRRLNFWYCDGMTILPEWIRNLSSLKSLSFHNCPKLTSIPEGIRSLTSLETLDISGCPILLKRCQRQIGDDWTKICHIPHVNLYPDPNVSEAEGGNA